MNYSAGILVVDDQEDITRFLIRSLVTAYPEVEVTGCTDGRQAIEWMEKNSPDIIITDLNMPGCGGVEVITAAVAQNPQVPIIVISGLASLEEFKTRANQFETVHFLPKPFMFADLVELLKKVASREPESVIHGFRPISLVQVVQLENKSCRIDLEEEESGKKGILIFQRGELKRAETHDLQGEAALFGILSFRNPVIRLFSAPPRFESNIEDPLHVLLLRYCQETDEASAKKK